MRCAVSGVVTSGSTLPLHHVPAYYDEQLEGTGQFLIVYNIRMIEIIRTAESAEADWVEAGLRDLVLEYERVVVLPGEAEYPLPALRYDGRLASGREALLQTLKELEELAEAWRRFQSDSCYVDDDGDCV